MLPAHLRTLARISGEVKFEVEGVVTVCSVLDALEAAYPTLSGTIRDHATHNGGHTSGFSRARRTSPMNRRIRRCRRRSRRGEPLLVIGAIAGG